MKRQSFSIWVFLAGFATTVNAGDFQCLDTQANITYTSTTSWFFCNIAPWNSGNCTWWAAFKRSDLAAAGITGDAGLWYDNAKNLGFNVGSEPRDGAIAVFSSPSHVAYTEKAKDDGSFDVSEMDAYASKGFNRGVNHATYHPDGGGKYHRNNGTIGGWTLKGFIYDRLFVPKVGQHLCARGKGVYGICWDIVTLANISCQGGGKWEVFPNDWELESAYTVSDKRYCPTDGGIGGGGSGPEDSSASPPITGGKHPGDLPNLIVHELYLVKEADRDSPHLSQIHIGERSYCNIQVKNTGEAGAWGTWANRCYLSKGNYRDHDPDNLGHESMTDLSAGQSRRVYQIIPAFEYPGKFNITACADTDGNDDDKKIMESDEGDNCHDEYRFDVVSDPNLATTAISLTSIVGNPVINQSFNISSTTTNLGENFGPDYVYIGYFVDGELVGQNQIRRENMRGGMSKAEEIPINGGIATAGVHEINACADFTDDIVETNESDNCRILLVNVTAPVSPILSINGVVLSNGTRHVFTDERPDISISIGNTGGISSPVTGEVFISSAPHGVENISLGTFQVGAVPEGGNATGTLSGVSFTKLGPWVLTACIEGMTTCASGDVVTVESSHPVNKHVNPAVLMILNKHRRERNER